MKSILWLQKQQEEMTDGFTVVYKENEFVFVPTFLERNDKKMDRLLTGKFVSYWLSGLIILLI